ncbi:Mitochondrial carrier protein MTM1 [Candida viswanathii]|uniref:Mitochondrial thiamine pyrophosphate carrier 1 n=1 Tax=Candida viswanathii TaxID=5486 RepID=A0A367XQU8_9ASCO|nr:Mitochondrial carrier protein MTM1 [Candida viswanathii]
MSLSSEIAAGGGIYEDSTQPMTPQEENISVTQRMISACSGSLITSLVVTPFDVIRIRIQQQEILPQTQPCCQVHFPEHTFAPSPSSPSAAATATATGTLSAEASSSAPELFWIHNKYCNSAENCTRITSTFQGFNTVARHEGIGTLWRGLSLTLLMAIPSNIIYFTGYEYIRDHSPISEHPLNPLFCGSLARTMLATFTAPFELIKTRLQAIPTDAKSSGHVLSNLLKDLMGLVRLNGAATLFKGLGITLWRDVPFSGIYWSSYEFLKLRISRGLKVNFNTVKSDDDWKVFITSFLSGSISGAIAVFFTNPFDVGKTRLQITMDEGNQHLKHKTNMFKFLYNIYRTEGVGALYAGFPPRVMKIAPACAIMISSYEIGKKFFKNNNSV